MKKVTYHFFISQWRLFKSTLGFEEVINQLSKRNYIHITPHLYSVGFLQFLVLITSFF